MTESTTGLRALLPADAGLSPARARLFTTALMLFGERGYHGVSVRDITDRLGQKPGAIYAHVESKQELLYELVRIGHVEHRDRLHAALRDAGVDADPETQAFAIIREHVSLHLEYPALARLVNGEFRFLSEAQVDAVVLVRGDAELELVDVIERGRRLGVFGVADTRLAVRAISAMGIRAAEWWQPELGMSADHVADTFAEFALKLLR